MEADVSDKPAYVRSRRVKQPGGYQLKRVCRGLLSVDQLVGRVVRTLRDLDRLDNTLLILTADNGMTFGSQRILNDKKSPYASQVPLHVRWPRVLGWDPPDVTERVQNIDLAPTLCDIAGCRLGPYPTGQARPDGRSFLKLLTGQRKALDRDAVLTSYQDSERRMPELLERHVDRFIAPGAAGVRHASLGWLPLDVHRVRDGGGRALRPEQRALPRLEEAHGRRPLHAHQPRGTATRRGYPGSPRSGAGPDAGRADALREVLGVRQDGRGRSWCAPRGGTWGSGAASTRSAQVEDSWCASRLDVQAADEDTGLVRSSSVPASSMGTRLRPNEIVAANSLSLSAGSHDLGHGPGTTTDDTPPGAATMRTRLTCLPDVSDGLPGPGHRSHGARTHHPA